LPEDWQRVVAICQWLVYGQVIGLLFRGGEPCFNPLPRLIKHGRPAKAPNWPQLQSSDNTVLRKHVIDLMEWVRGLGPGEFEITIDVADGLPVHWWADMTNLFFSR
jgi:hypothetical protein